MSLCVACALLWSIGGLAIYLIVRTGLLAEFDSALEANAQALATMTSQKNGRVEFDYDGGLLPAFGNIRRPDYFQLWLPDGSTLQRSASLQGHDLPRRAGGTESPVWNLTLPDGHSGRAIITHFAPPVDDEGPPSPARFTGEVTLGVARHRGELDHRLTLLATALLVVGAVMAGATALLVTIAVHRGLQPVSQLGERAATIDALSLQLRFPAEDMPAELLPIATRLNDLLARLEASFARERRFSADVAHELRTPIAELRALAEVALKWPEDVAASKGALQDALAIALQMESIVTSLLTIARCESGLIAVHTEPVALAALVNEACQPLNGQARAKRLSLSLEVPDNALWSTDPVLLRSIVFHLLANSVEYSPAGGSIRVRAGENGERGQLFVSNTTDNLRADDLPHLFDRFWRKDPARASTVHCGLGLALTKAYAESLCMALRVEMTSQREITFVLVGAQSCSEPV